MAGPEPDVSVGGQVKHDVAASHRPGQRLAVERVAFDESEPRAAARRIEERGESRGEVVEAHDIHRQIEETIDHVAANEACGSRDKHSVHVGTLADQG